VGIPIRIMETMAGYTATVAAAAKNQS